MAKYEDDYTARLKNLIESKVEDQPSVASPEEKEPPLINLMDALRRSVAQRSRGERGQTQRGASKRSATSHASRRRTPTTHRRTRQPPGELRICCGEMDWLLYLA